MPDPTEPFEPWLLRRVAHAVEAGEVSTDLVAELGSEMERARELPQEEGHALAVQDIAERLGLPAGYAERMLGALEVQPTVTRELLLRRIVEAWLEGQRTAYDTQQTAGKSDDEP